MALLTFKGGIHPDDGKSLAKDKAIVEVKPKGDLVYPVPSTSVHRRTRLWLLATAS